MDLGRFLAAAPRHGIFAIEHPEFAVLEMEAGSEYLDPRAPRVPVITISDIFAHQCGRGAFSRLLAAIRTARPDAAIRVVDVGPERFLAGLLRRGFRPERAADRTLLLWPRREDFGFPGGRGAATVATASPGITQHPTTNRRTP